MRRTTALLLLLLASTSLGWAQSFDRKALDTKAFGKKSDVPVARPKDRAGGMKACPEYGPGFYRLEGSSTCIQIGASIGTDVGARR